MVYAVRSLFVIVFLVFVSFFVRAFLIIPVKKYHRYILKILFIFNDPERIFRIIFLRVPDRFAIVRIVGIHVQIMIRNVNSDSDTDNGVGHFKDIAVRLDLRPSVLRLYCIRYQSVLAHLEKSAAGEYGRS